MEENVAILMADLAGYTALTETHGGISAAETVERYLHIVKGSIVGDCRLHEQTGDEVMIVSHSADDLLATADKILRASLFEDNFLPVHGGLHFGKALKRNRQYFGTAVNLAARITSDGSAANSAAYLRVSTRAVDQRMSIRALRPSVQPNACRLCANITMRACASARSVLAGELPSNVVNRPSTRP